MIKRKRKEKRDSIEYGTAVPIIIVLKEGEGLNCAVFTANITNVIDNG